MESLHNQTKDFNIHPIINTNINMIQNKKKNEVFLIIQKTNSQRKIYRMEKDNSLLLFQHHI